MTTEPQATTITIQIGNSDDKLTQKQWSEYSTAVKDAVNEEALEVHFFGCPPNWVPWQNVAWIICCRSEQAATRLKQRLAVLRAYYEQDSIAWTEGATTFI